MSLEEQKELTFKTEQDKIVALEALQTKGVTENDLAEIERITSAKVEDGPAASVENPQPDVPTAPPAEPKDDVRNWNITEDVISKFNETYVDDDGRTRPIITHKDPESFLKSYVESQKHIQFLKNQKLPKEFKSGERAGYEKAKSEYEAKIAALQQQRPPEKKPEPAPAPTGDTFGEYSKIVDDIAAIPAGDEIEHTDKLLKAIALSKKVIEENGRKYADEINKVREEINNDFTSFKSELQKRDESAAEEARQETERLQREQSVERLYSEIDNFSKTKEAPVEAKISKPYKEVVKDALAFHNELAELYTGKTAREVPPNEWQTLMENAGTAYLNGLPQLVQAVNANGIKEPSNYKQWVFLDNLDAIRVGYIRNANNQWEKRTDPITGQPVNFGDIKTAYNYYLDQSGKRKELMLKEKKKDNEALINAINKRDGAVIQLDESHLANEGDAGVLTEEKATEILQNSDVNLALAAAMDGRPETLNRINLAFQRLGQDPVKLDRQYSFK